MTIILAENKQTVLVYRYIYNLLYITVNRAKTLVLINHYFGGRMISDYGCKLTCYF